MILRSVTIIMFFMQLGCLNAQSLWQVYPDKTERYQLEFNDDFNDNAIDLEKWRVGLPWSRIVMTQDIIYVDQNVKEENGLAKFYIDRKDTLVTLNGWEVDSNYVRKNKITPVDGKYPLKYTGGLIWSKRDFQYGYFEVKFKAAKGQGIWPAFWLYGGNPNYEIDFFELKGEKEKQVHVDVHCPDGCGNFKEGPFGYYRKGFGQWIDVKDEIKDGFNVLAGEWTEKYIKWFLNGKLIAYFDKAPFNLKMGLTSGTGIAKDKAAFAPGPDKNTPFPNEFAVDYINVWTKTEVNKTSPLIFTKKTEGRSALKPQTEALQMNKTKKKKTKYYKKQVKPHAELMTVSIKQMEYTNNLLLNVFGESVSTATANLTSSKGKATSFVLIKGENLLDLSGVEPGEYVLEIKLNDKILNETILVK
ncbi:MAG TPA: glycoside hydrolase family 16 protein [Bacteroidia bacterium]